MSSIVDICNMALSHLGIGEEIASLTEKSEEARACNRFYSQCRDAMMREWDGQFPQYGLASNKGYPTTEHRASLREFGPSPLHRRSYAPVAAACSSSEQLLPFSELMEMDSTNATGGRFGENAMNQLAELPAIEKQCK